MTNAVEQIADIRDIKPPIVVTNPWDLAVTILGILIPLVLVLLLIWWLLRRKKKIVIPPPVPAHIRAKQKLEEALSLISQPKPFVIAVSDTARAYLEERFDFRAPERTTEEFLRELSETELLTPDQKDSLGNFLGSCDLVKFAKYEPGENELRALHDSALQLVEETEPKETSSAGVPPARIANSENAGETPALQQK